MYEHHSVLKEEAVEGMAIKPDGTYVDCTVGGGGHAALIASCLSNNGLLIALDQDPEALKAAEERLSAYRNKIQFAHANFRELETKLTEMKIGPVDGILFDLGVSSPQLDHGDRGFSYQQNALLDMRMNQDQELTASQIVNTWSYEHLITAFFQYGEEKFSKQIARKIENYRNVAPIETTYQLVEIIKDAIPAAARRKGGHPAKRIFQALRIAVNDELTALLDGIHQAARVVAINGRISIITFHSLEDRLCKQAFKKWSTTKEVPRNLPVVPEDHEAPFQLITRKPINPSDQELEMNRRSRSAKLRIAKKIDNWNETFTYTKGWGKT